jgi:Reverse transcriptase (RNA-dependent DNA polymerase)
VFHKEEPNLLPVNRAHIIFVPKVQSLQYVDDYRPISVINFLPKLISKVLANRLRKHLPHLISNRQTTFIQGHYIADNFLATRELLHHVEKSAEPTILLKLDFSKAIDSLDWNFLFNVLNVRGVPTKFIH